MSDVSQGAGWWLASDGKWYPPTAPPGVSDAVEALPPLPSFFAAASQSPFADAPSVSPPSEPVNAGDLGSHVAPPEHQPAPPPRPLFVTEPGASNPGWWRASDGEWYPPELNPSVRSQGGYADPSSVADHDASQSSDPLQSSRYALPAGWARPLIGLALVIAIVGATVGAVAAVSGPSKKTVGSPPPSDLGSVAPIISSQGSGSPSTTNGTSGTSSPTTGPVPSSSPTTSNDPAPTDASGSGPSLITAAIEQQVVATTWTGFSTAFADGDRTGIAQYTTAEADQAIDGSFDCGCPPWPTAYTSVSFSAPPQSSYPISFLAEFVGVNYDNSPLTKEVVFSQGSPGAPWLIAHLGSFVNGEPISDLSSNVSAAPPAVPTLITQVPETFATYFNTLDNTGKPPTPRPPGFSSNNYLSEVIGQSEQAYLTETAGGYKDVNAHAVGSVSPAFAVEENGQIEAVELCFYLDISTTVTRTNGSPVVQRADRSTFGNLLAPGSYSSLHETQTEDNCVSESITGTSYLLTNLGGISLITGVPS